MSAPDQTPEERAEERAKLGPRNVTGYVPGIVADAIEEEAKSKDRSVSWVVARALTDWYRRRPGAQTELRLVAETVDD